jgi:hypothetical protein
VRPTFTSRSRLGGASAVGSATTGRLRRARGHDGRRETDAMPRARTLLVMLIAVLLQEVDR